MIQEMSIVWNLISFTNGSKWRKEERVASAGGMALESNKGSRDWRSWCEFKERLRGEKPIGYGQIEGFQELVEVVHLWMMARSVV